jgi:hypothetical protein
MLSRNNQQYAHICTTALFYMLAPTYFSSCLPSSGSFWIRLSYVKIQIDMVVYHIMLVKWPVCRGSVCCASQLSKYMHIRTQLGTATVHCECTKNATLHISVFNS